jgi:hypothetical protein
LGFGFASVGVLGAFFVNFVSVGGCGLGFGEMFLTYVGFI